MPHVIFGVHSHLTKWCCEVIDALLQAAGKPTLKLELNTVEDLAVHLIAQREEIIFASRRPEASLIRSLDRAGLPYVLVTETLVQSAHFRTRDLGQDPLAAVRDVLGDIAALRELTAQDAVLRIEHNAIVTDPTGQIARIAHHLGLAGPDEAAIHQRKIDLFECLLAESADLSRLNGEQPSIARAVGQMGNGFETTSTERMLLGREFFHPTEGITLMPSGAIDVTGRARGLVDGPFVCLPRGDWIARCTHRYSEDLALGSFAIDVVHFAGGTLHELARSSFKIPAAGGVVETVLQFRVEDPATPLEVRLFVENSIFNGEVLLGYVELRRASPTVYEPFPL